FLRQKMNLLMILTIAVFAAMTAAQEGFEPETCETTVCPIGSNCTVKYLASECVLPPNSDPKAQRCPKSNYIFKMCSKEYPPKCGDYTPTFEKICGAQKCQCDDGFYLNDAGDCVTGEECEGCKKNQIFTTCSSACAPKCGEYLPIRLCRECGPPKCVCKVGFYENSNGDCVTREECEKPRDPITVKRRQCPKNQKYSGCPSSCPAICGLPEPISCTRDCGGDAKCECKEGFFYDSNGDCVTKQECNKSDIMWA
ncbi:hypothetical protein PMAYCL1PPCAC_32396, partial [Pristionchus mayeri]